jgi:hypothetical protein
MSKRSIDTIAAFARVWARVESEDETRMEDARAIRFKT